MTLGKFVSDKRKSLILNQKELAERIRKEDGNPISPQYLNDIEHDRRIPSDHVIEEFARVLKLPQEDKDYLYHLAGSLPVDLKRKRPQEDVVKGYRAFRKTLKRKADDKN